VNREPELRAALPAAICQAHKINATNATANTNGRIRMPISALRAKERGLGNAQKEATPNPVAASDRTLDATLAVKKMSIIGVPHIQP
jgi:hypothetical protein